MSNDPMTDIPSFEDAQSLTDWVIDTAAATEINAYTLWLIVRRASDKDEGELEKTDVDPELLETMVSEAVESEGEYVPEPRHEPEPEPAPEPEPTQEFDWGELEDDEFSMPEPSGDVVTQAEYEQFKVEVQGLIQNLIEFLISYDMLSDEPPEEREELISEFEKLTRNFEEDVSEFFNHLDELLEEAQREEFEAADDHDEDVVFDADERMSDLMGQLRSSIQDLKGLRAGASEPEADEEEPDLEALTAQLEDSDVKSDEEVRQVLGRLNRLLDEVGEYPEQSRPRREERRQPEREAPPEEYDEAYDESYDDRYEEPYDEQYDEDWGRAEAPAFASHESRRYETRTEQTQTEEYDAGLWGLGLLPIDFAWLGAGITYGGLDMFTTALVLQAGGQELNPLFDLLGGSLAGFVLWKTFVLFLLFVFFYPDDPVRPQSLQWWVPLIVTAAGIVLTVSNLFVLIG